MNLLADIPLFVGLANAGHFGRAAAALDMPASTLSRRIRVMEKELGVSLVNRSTRVLALTDAGQTLYERGRRLMAEASRIREDMGREASALSGHVRIGVRLELAYVLFVPLLAEFSKANSGISLEIISTDGQPTLADAIDLAFVVSHQTPLRDSSQKARRIGTFPRQLFASKVYLQHSPGLHKPSDLKDHSCLRLSRGIIEKEWNLRCGRERQTVSVSGSLSATSIGLLAQLAREHHGVTTLWPYLASHPAYGNDLVRVLPDWEAAPGQIFALTANQLLPAKITRLLDYVKSGIGKRLGQMANTQASH